MKPRIARQRHTERDGGGDLGFAGREADHVKCHFAKRAGRERWWDEKTSLGGIDASDRNLGRLSGETTATNILADVHLTRANHDTVCMAANLSYSALRTLVPSLHGFRSATDRKHVSCGVFR